MGKYLSKEEIVIAQNNAIENHMHKYEVPVIATVSLLGIVIIATVWRYYRHRVKKWLNRQVSGAVAAMPAASSAATTQPPASGYV